MDINVTVRTDSIFLRVENKCCIADYRKKITVIEEFVYDNHYYRSITRNSIFIISLTVCKHRDPQKFREKKLLRNELLDSGAKRADWLLKA